jgi:hypothetical protein
MIKRFTIREVLDAMEKNGYPKLTNGHYVKWDKGQVVAACAIGQAALNLGVKPADLNETLYAPFVSYGNRFRQILDYYIPNQNDRSAKTVPQIAREFRELVKDHLDIVIEVEGR